MTGRDIMLFLFKLTFTKKTSYLVKPTYYPFPDRDVFWKAMVTFHEAKLKRSKIYSEKL